MKALLKRKAKIDLADSKGYTPLMMACATSDRFPSSRCFSIVEPIPTCGRRMGCTPLAFSLVGRRTSPFGAFMGNHSHDVLLLLLEHGADPKVKLREGITLIAMASVLDDTEAIEVLSGKGLDVNEKSTQGATALMFAAVFAKARVVKCLLDHAPIPILRWTMAARP